MEVYFKEDNKIFVIKDIRAAYEKAAESYNGNTAGKIAPPWSPEVLGYLELMGVWREPPNQNPLPVLKEAGVVFRWLPTIAALKSASSLDFESIIKLGCQRSTDKEEQELANHQREFENDVDRRAAFMNLADAILPAGLRIYHSFRRWERNGARTLLKIPAHADIFISWTTDLCSSHGLESVFSATPNWSAETAEPMCWVAVYHAQRYPESPDEDPEFEFQEYPLAEALYHAYKLGDTRPEAERRVKEYYERYMAEMKAKQDRINKVNALADALVDEASSFLNTEQSLAIIAKTLVLTYLKEQQNHDNTY